MAQTELCFGIVGQSTAATENIDTDTASVALDIHDLDETDLTGSIHMGSTAGAQIHARDLHDADIFRESQLTAII